MCFITKDEPLYDAILQWVLWNSGVLQFWETGIPIPFNHQYSQVSSSQEWSDRNPALDQVVTAPVMVPYIKGRLNFSAIQSSQSRYEELMDKWRFFTLLGPQRPRF